MKRSLLGLGLAVGLLLLGACTQAQTQSAQDFITTAAAAVQTACQGAQVAAGQAQAAVKGGAANTVANISSYVTAGCATANGIAALAANPSSLAWLSQITGQLTTLKSIADGTTPAPAAAVTTAPASSS